MAAAFSSQRKFSKKVLGIFMGLNLVRTEDRITYFTRKER